MRLAAASRPSFVPWRPWEIFSSADFIDDQKRPISGLFGIGRPACALSMEAWMFTSLLSSLKARRFSCCCPSLAFVHHPEVPARRDRWSPPTFCGPWGCRSPVPTVRFAFRCPVLQRMPRLIPLSVKCPPLLPGSGRCRLSAGNI